MGIASSTRLLAAARFPLKIGLFYSSRARQVPRVNTETDTAVVLFDEGQD